MGVCFTVLQKILGDIVQFRGGELLIRVNDVFIVT
jgi:hypothetical protein